MSIVVTPDSDIGEFVDQAVEEVNKLELDISPRGFGVWSQSKIKTLSNCPLQFLLKNIMKISVQLPVSKEDQGYDESFLSSIGTSAHSIIEFMAKGHEYEVAHGLAKEAHISKVTEEQWHRVESLEDNIKHFFHRIHRFSVENPIERIETEVKFALDYNWNATSFFSKNAYFRGVIDMPILLKNRDVLLVDHKHGGSSQHGTRIHDFQLKSYAVGYMAHNRDVRGAVPAIHYIQEGGIAMGEYVPREKALTEFTITLESAIHGAVDSLKDYGIFKHCRGYYCNYCEFKPICHGGKRGTAGQLQPVVEASKTFFRG